MSFRLFVYWCALCGGWAAAAGWGLGRLAAGEDSLGSAGIKGMCLGMLIALALGVVDALWVYSLRQPRHVTPRVLACVAVGTVGGLLGGFVGQLLFDWKNWAALLVLGWGLTGLMVGVSLGAFDFLRGWVREEDLGPAGRKVLRGVLGGTAGGLLGGFLYWQLRGVWANVFPDKVDLWSPSATGFVALGLCIGLMIGVAQVVLKEAWLLVEAGFRRGRELPLTKPVLTVGRAESCDIGLFGDPTIDPLHARILRRGDGYLLADAGSGNGTFVNELRVTEPVPLHSGDLIRLGGARLRFRERQKRAR
jgi:hypothetical protein